MLTNPTLFTATFSVLARIDAWFDRRRQRTLETYLATSQNVFELETRMRDLARATPHPYY